MTRILVTGADGFVGKPLLRALADAHLDAIPVGREHGNLCRPQAWSGLPSADAVIHLAGRSYVPDSWQRSCEFLEANVLATSQALEYCRRNGARLIFVSAYVYGIPQRLPIREDDPARPNNPYALSKRMAEELCEFYANYRGVPVTVLRVFNVFGPGQRAEFLIPEILRQVRDGDRICVKDLAPKRDYVYLDDVVDALVRAVSAPGTFNMLNIGSGESLSVADIIDSIQRVAGTSLPVVSAEASRVQEIPEVQADISRARETLSWQPEHNFAAGIAAMLRIEP